MLGKYSEICGKDADYGDFDRDSIGKTFCDLKCLFSDFHDKI